MLGASTARDRTADTTAAVRGPDSAKQAVQHGQLAVGSSPLNETSCEGLTCPMLHDVHWTESMNRQVADMNHSFTYVLHYGESAGPSDFHYARDEEARRATMMAKGRDPIILP